MLPRPNGKYVGCGPLTLARLTVKFEGEDDIGFLAVQDAVSILGPVELALYRDAYRDAMRQYVARHSTDRH